MEEQSPCKRSTMVRFRPWAPLFYKYQIKRDDLMFRKNLKENSNEFPAFEQFKNIAHRERFSYVTSTSTCKKIYIRPIDFSTPHNLQFFLGVSEKADDFPGNHFIDNPIDYNLTSGFVKDVKDVVPRATYTFYNSTLTFYCNVFNDKGHIIKPISYDHIIKVPSFTNEQKAFFENLKKDFISSSHELLNAVPELIKQINQTDANHRGSQLKRDYDGIADGIRVQATEAEKISYIRQRLKETE